MLHFHVTLCSQLYEFVSQFLGSIRPGSGRKNVGCECAATGAVVAAAAVFLAAPNSCQKVCHSAPRFRHIFSQGHWSAKSYEFLRIPDESIFLQTSAGDFCIFGVPRFLISAQVRNEQKLQERISSLFCFANSAQMLNK